MPIANNRNKHVTENFSTEKKENMYKKYKTKYKINKIYRSDVYVCNEDVNIFKSR